MDVASCEPTQNFLASLRVMGLGMLGIFSVAVALMLIMMLLTKLFPTKKEENQPEDGERS